MSELNCGSCTQCCKAIHIRRSPDIKSLNGSDAKFIRANWKKISIRRAKKINPYIFSRGKIIVKKVKRDMQFYRCVNLTPTGCAAYESRPPVCSGYPYYGNTPNHNMAKDYSADCVYILNVE